MPLLPPRSGGRLTVGIVTDMLGKLIAGAVARCSALVVVVVAVFAATNVAVVVVVVAGAVVSVVCCVNAAEGLGVTVDCVM